MAKKKGPKGGPHPPKGGAGPRSRAAMHSTDGPPRRRPPQMPMDEDDETPLLEEDLDGESPMPPRRAKMPTIVTMRTMLPAALRWEQLPV